MHRTIEMLEIGKLNEERRRLNEQIDETEDADEAQALEDQVAEIAAKLEKMKRYVRDEDRKHKAGVGKVLSQAWLEEKKRRRATLHRAQNARERAAVKVKLEEEWTRKFKTEQAREYMDGDTERIESQIETEVVEESKDSNDKLKVHRGAKETDERKATKRVHRALTKEELDQFREEQERAEEEKGKEDHESQKSEDEEEGKGEDGVQRTPVIWRVQADVVPV